LIESFECLTEEQRKLAEHNANFLTANEMAKAGHSSNEIHNFLSATPEYTTHALYMWYLSGGDVPVINYVRSAAIKAFDLDKSKIKEPKFEGDSIHDNVVTTSMVNTMISYKKFISSSLNSLPNQITLYRGVGMSKETSGNEYKPHALESWTTDIETARKFSQMSHIPDSIPHLFKATVNKEHIFSSHFI
jgi:hypothetical protein